MQAQAKPLPPAARAGLARYVALVLAMLLILGVAVALAVGNPPAAVVPDAVRLLVAVLGATLLVVFRARVGGAINRLLRPRRPRRPGAVLPRLATQRPTPEQARVEVQEWTGKGIVRASLALRWKRGRDEALADVARLTHEIDETRARHRKERAAADNRHQEALAEQQRVLNELADANRTLQLERDAALLAATPLTIEAFVGGVRDLFPGQQPSIRRAIKVYRQFGGSLPNSQYRAFVLAIKALPAAEDASMKNYSQSTSGDVGARTRRPLLLRTLPRTVAARRHTREVQRG
jgi:hypothetical protein